MRKIVAIVLLVTTPLAGLSQDRSVGIALERFATISGGWWLDQRCKILSAEEAASFARDLSVVNVALTTTLNDPATVLRLQGSARKGAEDPRYASCSDEVRDIVKYTATTVGAWSNDIRRSVLEGAAKLPGPR